MALAPEAFKITSAPSYVGWLAVMLLFPFSSASAQDASELELLLQELKQHYEQTTEDLRHRIAALEQELERQKEATAEERDATVSAAEVAPRETAQRVFF